MADTGAGPGKLCTALRATLRSGRALSGVVTAWLAALIVGAALLAVAAAAALPGKGSLQKAAPPLPGQAVARIKTDVDVIRERTRR